MLRCSVASARYVVVGFRSRSHAVASSLWKAAHTRRFLKAKGKREREGTGERLDVETTREA